MNIIVEDPPVNKVGLSVKNFEFNDNIYFYLDYDYLPLKNISLIIKGVNELYELVYSILNDENIPEKDRLVLEFAKTGNSLEWIGQVLSHIKSKKAKVAILLAAALIYTPIGYGKYEKDIAEKNKTDAETAKTIAETEKIRAEKESIDLENIYKKNKLSEDSINKLNSEKNRKRIMRKRNVIKRAIEHPAINICIVNNITIVKGE